VIAFIGSIIGFFVIFFLAKYLARLTIRPIQEHNKELESYSHNVAHELRTPLSVMRSNLELLRIKPEDRFIQSTDDEISNMEHIIESLLFLAKPTRNNIENRKVNIVKLTEECIEKYRAKDNIQWETENIDISENIDSELYKRMLSNLIENAIKYKSEWNVCIEIKDTILSIKNTVEKIYLKEKS